jgi:hypothetical protein
MEESLIFKRQRRAHPFLTALACLFLSAGSNTGYIFAQTDHAANEAAQIKILSAKFEKVLGGKKAPSGKIFVVCETEWENVHPKQKVDKEKLEGKVDRTMGVGGLAGGKKDKKAEFVEVDVAYQVRRLQDHAYLLADGTAYALHESTEDIPGGYKMGESFTIAKQGEIKKVNLAFLVPEGSDNLGFQFFDYQYGHITLPVKGSLQMARGSGGPSGKILGQAKTDVAEFAAHALDFQAEYLGKSAPEGWRYAVVQLSGKSLSGGDIRNIVQFKPEEYVWVTTDGGYLYNCSDSSTSMDGFVRFTPEIYQYQELAFLVPDSAENFSAGIRIKNQVLHLDLTEKSPEGMPVALASHKDGEVMEVMLFGRRTEQGKTIVDLGIRSLYGRGGLEIQTGRQFFLLVGEKEYEVDMAATDVLLHCPPQPFVVPPEASIRFELAFDTEDNPVALRFRGYRSEGHLKF